MKMQKTICSAVIVGALALGCGVAIAADDTGKMTAPGTTPGTTPGQVKATGQPAAPAAKPVAPGQTGAKPDTLGATVAADCAKLTDPKAKDECVKKAQAATDDDAAGMSKHN